MQELTIINQEGNLLVDSREVAEMIDKEHDQLLRSIRSYINILDQSAKLQTANFFIESTYKNENNQSYPCYLLTKQGCEMVANKMTGQKGILFTAEYVQAFNQMEQGIKQPKKLTALDQLKLQNEAILEVNEKVDKLQNDMPLFKAECDELIALVRKIGMKLLGGKSSSAYKSNSLRGRVYSDIQHQLRREFGVDKYAWIKHSQFASAKDVVSAYTLPKVLKEDIEQVNNQIEMEAI